MDGKRFPTDGELAEICMLSDSEKEFPYDISSEEDNNDDAPTCDPDKAEDELEELPRKRRKPISSEYGWKDPIESGSYGPYRARFATSRCSSAKLALARALKYLFSEHNIAGCAIAVHSRTPQHLVSK